MITEFSHIHGETLLPRSKYAPLVSLVLILAVVLGVSISVALAAFESWADYEQPYKPNLSPVSLLNGNVTPLGNYAVVVVIDGARPDIVEEVEVETPNIDWIKGNGTWFKNARCFTPSLSQPGYASIGTGARPIVSGVTSNWIELNGDVGIDNIFKIVNETGDTTAVAGSPGWMDLYGNWISENKTIEGKTLDMDEVIGEWAVSLIEHKPKLLLVHLYDTDTAGHKYGGAASDVYKQQIEGADKEIGEIIEAFNNSGILEETLFIVTSDHGFLDEGNHGGWEEEVLHILLTMRGPCVKHLAVEEEVLQDQIAATVSFFLGYRVPTGLTGGILFDVFDVDERRKTVYQTSLAQVKYNQSTWFAEQFNLREKYENNISRLEEDLTSAQQLFSQGQYGEALVVAEGIEEDCENLIETVWDEKHSKEISSRLQITSLIYVLALVPSVIIIFILRKRTDWRIFLVAIFCAIGYSLGFWASFFASGWYFSISVWESPEDFIIIMALFMIVGLSAAGLTTGLTANWLLDEKNRRFKVILAALLGLFLVVIVNTIYISFYHVQWNYVLGWYFPEGRAWGDFIGNLFMLAQNFYLAILSFVSIVVALVTSKMVSKLSKTRT